MVLEKVETFKYIEATNRLMRTNGLFLCSGDMKEANKQDLKLNVMTIGWGFLGTIWSLPVFIVAVRHSRHTFAILEKSNSFTVCLPTKNMKKELDYAGSKSGRDTDKFKELKLTPKKGFDVDAPYIKESPIHYECEILYKDDMEPGKLIDRVEKVSYKTKDMHMIYFGQVKGCYALKSAIKKISK